MSATPSISVLDSVVASLREAFEDDLVSVVLFGSAAEKTDRPLQNPNVLVVLRRFDRERVDRVHEVVRSGQASVKLNAMFLVEGELPRAAEAFAVKFADLLRRRRVVFGTDVLAALTVPREARIRRLRQVLLNLKLRLRWFYVVRSLREEQAATLATEMAGPLRVAAASLYALEGTPIQESACSSSRSLWSGKAPGWSEALSNLRRPRRRNPAAGPRALSPVPFAGEAEALKPRLCA